MKKITRKSIDTIINKTEKYLAKIKEMNENKEDPEKIKKEIFNITSTIFSELVTPQSNFMSYAEDLMQLSVEMNVPIIVAIQTNKTGVRDSDDVPELDTIRNSDCILHNASRAISITNNTDNSISKINKILERRIN